MSDINVCTIMGRLTEDAASRTVGAKGMNLVEFTIANNTGSGQYAHTSYFKVNLWGKLGEALVQYLKKGKGVVVSGMLENRQWQDNTGNTRDSWQLTANEVTLLSDAQAKTVKEEEEIPQF